VTGFAAHFSNAVVSKNLVQVVYFVLVPVFFLIGAFFSALFTEIRRKRKLSPVYIHVLSLLAFLYLLVSLFGRADLFGRFGEPLSNFRDFILLSILTFSCGAQNALFTHYSNSIIRTTHLTGLTTDLGIGLAKVFVAGDSHEAPINHLRMELIGFFILGSLVGAFVFPVYEFLGFLLPRPFKSFCFVSSLYN